MTIGIFDSGKGGEIVAKQLRYFFPERQFSFLVVNDQLHLPYGDKTPGEIARLADAAMQPLLEQARIIIVACNTVTAVAISYLRAKYPDHSFIGFEPAIKPAANDTKAKKIMVLATPTTLKSAKYLALKKRYADGIKVIEPDCSTWALKIENDESMAADLAAVVELAQRENVDEIVLGCTHYLAIEKDLRANLPSNIAIVEPIAAIARRLTDVIRDLSPKL
ncbi:aspartate/glutamate racemase family protein [Candidatus Saccharibacteria bacterium]|nr:aspartate/glutamate racemase family protein [Candidatus Saccharibacteria bacterium]